MRSKERSISAFGDAIENNALLVRAQNVSKPCKNEAQGRKAMSYIKKIEVNKKYKDGQFCDYFHAKGHVRNSCFKLHGYLEWYKEQRRKPFNKAMVNMAKTPLEAYADDKDDGKAECTSDLSKLVQQEIMKLMKGKLLLKGNHINLVGNYAGNLSLLKHALSIALSSTHLLDTGTWILDTGASNHMCAEKNLFNNLTHSQKPL